MFLGSLTGASVCLHYNHWCLENGSVGDKTTLASALLICGKEQKSKEHGGGFGWAGGEKRVVCVSACLCARSCVGVRRLLEGDEQGIVKA